MDVHDKDTRTRNMRAIRGRNTGPEIKVRKLLHRNGYRYSLAPFGIPGKPDIWMAKWNTAIFVNGCFWHKHDCFLFKLPKTRTRFWKEKLNQNKARDHKILKILSKRGIRTLSIWECALRGKYKMEEQTLLILIRTFLLTGHLTAEISSEGLNIN